MPRSSQAPEPSSIGSGQLVTRYDKTLPTVPPKGAVGNGAEVPFDTVLAGGKPLMGGPTT